MWCGDGDVPGTCFVVDLEWVGNSHVPSKAHVTQIAAMCVASGAKFSCLVRPFASSAVLHDSNTSTGLLTTTDHSLPAATAFVKFIDFLRTECSNSVQPIVLIAHNGIRFDSPILLDNMRRCGLDVPRNIVFLDSLHHFRHHLRHREGPIQYDLDSICAQLDIAIEPKHRHMALYDVELLHMALVGMQDRWDIPYISGLPQHLNAFSPMLVRGIGPTVCMHLHTSSLLELGGAIIDMMGSLSPECCLSYLESLDLCKRLPTLDICLIAQHIGPTAERYLHYLP